MAALRCGIATWKSHGDERAGLTHAPRRRAGYRRDARSRGAPGEGAVLGAPPTRAGPGTRMDRCEAGSTPAAPDAPRDRHAPGSTHAGIDPRRPQPALRAGGLACDRRADAGGSSVAARVHPSTPRAQAPLGRASRVGGRSAADSASRARHGWPRLTRQDPKWVGAGQRTPSARANGPTGALPWRPRHEGRALPDRYRRITACAMFHVKQIRKLLKNNQFQSQLARSGPWSAPPLDGPSARSLPGQSTEGTPQARGSRGGPTMRFNQEAQR